MTAPSSRVAAFDRAVAAARSHLARAEPAASFALLERAHVLGQRDFGRHWVVHALMLRAGWALADGREVRGQLLRLALIPLGHLLCKLPLGNTGGSNVSAFAPMPVPPDLQQLLMDDDR
jgi:hypothetical protein